jgi:hypothetical protein
VAREPRKQQKATSSKEERIQKGMKKSRTKRQNRKSQPKNKSSKIFAF